MKLFFGLFFKIYLLVIITICIPNYFQAMDFLTKMNNEGVIEFQPELFLTKPKQKLSSEIKANKAIIQMEATDVYCTT